MKALCFGPLVALAMTPVAAGAVTIDFDFDDDGAPIAPNTAITDQYEDFGVTFLGLEDGSPVDINAGPDPDGDPQPSVPNSLTNCSDASTFCPGNRADILRITFDGAASSVSVLVNTLGGLAVTFDAFDTSGIFIEQQTIVGTYELLSFSSSGIGRIDILQPTDNWAYAIDDLSFDLTAAAVPAPAALGLLGLGLFGLAARRRKS